ncbi:MAG: fumarylacetoacetate hydrolase, partial [Comamonas sp.]
MLVRVSSTAINRATTPLQVLNNVDRIVPYIELPDLMVQDPKALDGAGVEAINVGSRLGVMGEAIPIPQYRDERYALINALQSMQITLKDQTGSVMGSGRGGDLMGQPLNAVVWLVQALQQENQRLKVGDWVSLGSFSALLPPKAGQQITVEYKGLPGAQPVVVTFE